MNFKKNKIGLNLIFKLILTILIVALVSYKDFEQKSLVFFVADIQTSTSSKAQVFFNLGSGYNETDSSSLEISQSENYHRYRFPIPKPWKVEQIRFDPTATESVVSIKNIGIQNNFGNTVKKFTPESFSAVSQIEKIQVNQDTLRVYTSKNAFDPILLIENSSLVGLIKYSWIKTIYEYWFKYIGYLITILIALTVVENIMQIKKIKSLIHSSIKYSSVNPRKIIFIVSLISVILASYPIIFFGKSYLSPIGVASLYTDPPFVPGLETEKIVYEDYRFSDIGATFWHSAPNSVAQNISIFKDFEFPFWNRYVGFGTPLYGQGQSMIGDVLHWIPVLFESSALSWDIKFILSKLIFSVGMGLLVFHLTNNLLAGSMIAISSCFLGFYAFRFNHPALTIITYAPWILLQWSRFGHAMAMSCPKVSNCVLQGVFLAVITWLSLSSGAVKECVITVFFMQLFGMLIFINHTYRDWKFGKSILIACGLGLAFVMVMAPFWVIFLDTLDKSFSLSDSASARPFDHPLILGFFDNYFFQSATKQLAAPSTNLFVLFSMSAAFFSLRFKQSCLIYGSWILFFLAMSIGYGIIPISILLTIPLINNIHHLGNTFSVPMMIFSLILAGYGVNDYLGASKENKRKMILTSILILIGMLIIFYTNYKTDLLVILFLIIITFWFIQLYTQIKSNSLQSRNLFILVLCFALMHSRHGMHLMTGSKYFDSFVTNPTERADFSIKSEAIEYVKHQIKNNNFPTRVIGEGQVLFPGFNTRYALEGVVSVEPLRNKYYEELLALVDYPDIGWGWLRLISSNQISSRSASLDMMGVGYIVAKVGTVMPDDMTLVHSSDLDVWQRKSVWPRAFFANNVLEIRESTFTHRCCIADIRNALSNSNNTPFAAVESDLMKNIVLDTTAKYEVIPAREYLITSNKTEFTVDASGPGIVVLGETYYPDDFVVTVNGINSEYIRVNGAFKGVWISEAGSYNISFTYRPEKLNLSIIIFLCGFALLMVIIYIHILRIKRK